MKLIIFILIAYLLGSIPTGLWIGQRFYHINLREHGSGNTGTTNTFRILGIKAGLTTLAIDILKGTVATILPVLFGLTTVSPIVIGFFAVLGHTFPIFAKFKGGKAVATSAGVLLGFAPLYLFFLASIFVLVLYLFSMISLASVVSAIVGVLSVLTFPAIHFLLPNYDYFLTFIVILLAFIIIIRHKDNISRIKHHTENLIPWGLNLSKQVPKK
ncbi:TPA: glycerol-3-phosphate 1-O-acyltransferase PlsY [Streptococcus pyogenes]|uniref:glycerol-3-phosphate 1-O-acyltransferase PlsY n=1 Tax=Streptococcus pyogenes TaxID=1314 RepID=UPI0010A1DDD6|nr:glycerol-3-phosphate 1-O-acyltransferase PlsY [Streptococcus pyogenes]HER6475090.1 glycerol-3-phosphate 1-O-acyltransferase PlsY [Streptococcus pyogenes]HER6476842.1 glycerol-3-phosphate 1-O-acyltransferase PlsY [Streptococcus pyogenes]HER6480406.1 glycerol-3-phosphate 1-O-acyltransferase PlsY [Streptococcus pyogenes]HER6483753.1 glycerol-3-phosphate 1-O-acyltransferase PlsY [Streptococcus pyogenes]HER6485342.1 glycerol-3-phosphate 1-O-acyltransferase PlsY [Streptococcus pyogenes]